MNKSQEKTSQIEKEKLKKRLQKLFQKQEKEASKKSDNIVTSNLKTVHHEKKKSTFQTTESATTSNHKNISKTQRLPTVNKSKKKDLQKEEKRVKKPATNGSFKSNFESDKSLGKSPANSKSKQNKHKNEIKTSQTEPLPQQNGVYETSTVKLKNNSNANKNTNKSKNFKQEKTTPQKSIPQTKIPKKHETLKSQNKAEIFVKNKSPATNGDSSETKTYQKNSKVKKRKVTSETTKEHPVTNKKPKLSDKMFKSLKKDKFLNYCDSSNLENVYDKNMKGLVRGGDYDDSDGDEIDDEYWLNQNNNDENEDSDSSENFSRNELIEHTLPYSDGEEESFESDSDYSYDEEGEEEEQRYSDFDEDDYDEEEDSYDYFMDSEEEYSSDYDDNDTSYDFNDDEHDDDYELPKHIPEDLIIHRGTATKRDIKPEDNVSFNSDDEEPQIIELQKQEAIKLIQQPKAYDKEELVKLKYSEKTIKTISFLQNSTDISSLKGKDNKNDTKKCPRLVPIVDKDGFQLYNPNEGEEEGEYEEKEEAKEIYYGYENESVDEYEDYDEMDEVSLGSEYEELNSDDAESLLSEDINDKYLNRSGNDSESADEIDAIIWKGKHKVDIIDATSCKYVDKKGKNTNDESEESLSDNIKQLPSVKLYENVDLKTASSILSATIIDKIEQKRTLKLKETVQESLINKEFSESMEESFESDNTNQSVVEDSTFENQQTNRVKTSKAQSLINYNTKFFNAFDSNLVMVLLKDPFYIYGTVRLTLLAGHVEVYGNTLSVDTEVEIFSPRGCSAVEITPTPKCKISSKLDLKDILKNYEKHFALADLKTIRELYDCEHDAVVLLKRNETRKKIVQQFKKFMNENVFPNINNINMERPLYNTEYLLRCLINTSNQEQKCLRIPQQWQQFKITPQSRVMVTGGKSVGKSTLIRYLINRHMPQRILLIDLDIGQPEVFIPQTVSCTVVKQPLLGPGFMLNLEPDISFAVGHTNIAMCAHKYVDAVRNLIAHCMKEEKYQELPWLVNTMGYNKGFGLELISVITKEFTNLTDLIQLQSVKEINNFDAVLFPHVLQNVPRNMFITEEHSESSNLVGKDYRLHVWQSAVQQESRYLKEWEMSAKDLRFAMLLTRLSQALQGHAEWLTDCKPLSAPLDALKIVNLMDNTPLATTEELTKSLEANLAYLCHYQEDNKPLKCFGIGVIRAIDFHVRQVYLLPAVSHSLLKYVNCLALGEMCLPTSIFTNQGPRIKNTAAFVYNTIDANASKAIKQIYHRPRRFLTGKHKSLD